MDKGLWMPVYEFEENRFIIIGNPVYDSKPEAIGRAIADGFWVMCQENQVIARTDQAFRIPFSESDAQWLLNCHFLPEVEVCVFAGPLYEQEFANED